MSTELLYILFNTFIATFGIYFFVKLFLIFYLWFRYDRKIKSLRDKIFNVPNEMQKDSMGRGRTTAIVDAFTKSALRPIESELKLEEERRRLFLDRINLLFSLHAK